MLCRITQHRNVTYLDARQTLWCAGFSMRRLAFLLEQYTTANGPYLQARLFLR